VAAVLADRLGDLAQDTMHAPAHCLAARPAAVAGVTPIIDFAGGTKGVVDEGPSDLTLQTTPASVRSVRAELQVWIPSPTVRGVGPHHSPPALVPQAWSPPLAGFLPSSPDHFLSAGTGIPRAVSQSVGITSPRRTWLG
jgi:hypothetical protein